MSIRKSGISPVLAIVLVCLFCSALNLFNYSLYFAYIAVFFGAICTKKMIINRSAFLLLFYAVTLLIFSPSFHSSLQGIIKLFSFFFVYILGYDICLHFGQRDKNDGYKTMILLLLASAAGGLAHYLLNWTINIGAGDRNTIDFWTGALSVATNQAALASIALGVSVAILLTGGMKAHYKVLAFACVLAILGYNLTLSGRTLIALMALVFVVAFVYALAENKGGRGKYLVSIIVIVGILFVAFQYDWFGLRTLVEDSPLIERFTGEYAMDITEDSRGNARQIYLEHIFEYPFGGLHLRPIYGYAHDLFLDSFDEGGWFTLFAIFIYFLSSVFRLQRVLKAKRIPLAVRQIVLGAYVAVYVEFFVEPVLQASSWLLVAFCVLDGAVSALLRIEKEYNKKQTRGMRGDARDEWGTFPEIA